MKTTDHEKAGAVEPIVICAHCGSNKGYWQKALIKQWVGFDNHGLTPNFTDTPISVKFYGIKRCGNCDKRIERGADALCRVEHSG